MASQEVKMVIPDSFVWVLEEMKKCEMEGMTGDLVVRYTTGGISSVRKEAVKKPPKK